jgi:hypothetical protein
MTSGRAGGLKNREPLKADYEWVPPKGGLRSVARSGVKGVARRNHEAPSMPWTGRANRSWIPATVSAPRRGDRRSPDRPASSCGSRSEPPGKGLTRPMLSAANALDPGPQPKQPGNVNPPQPDPRQTRGFTLRKLHPIRILMFKSDSFIPKGFLF